jgi:hypothetical protein
MAFVGIQEMMSPQDEMVAWGTTGHSVVFQGGRVHKLIQLMKTVGLLKRTLSALNTFRVHDMM